MGSHLARSPGNEDFNRDNLLKNEDIEKDPNPDKAYEEIFNQRLNLLIASHGLLRFYQF